MKGSVAREGLSGTSGERKTTFIASPPSPPHPASPSVSSLYRLPLPRQDPPRHTQSSARDNVVQQTCQCYTWFPVRDLRLVVCAPAAYFAADNGSTPMTRTAFLSSNIPGRTPRRGKV